MNHTDDARNEAGRNETGRTGTPRRILVTGAAGFVGAHIATHLAARGHHVLTTDVTAHPNGLTGDLCDAVFRGTLLAWARADVLVHAAALVPLTRDRAGFTTTNVEASRALAAEARLAGAERFVLIGSSAVYGVPRAHPITARTRARPIEPYGRSKLAAESATRDGWRQGGGQLGGEQPSGLTILRPRTILGNGRRGIIGTLDRWIADDLVIPLPGAGRHRLQLVDVEDVCRIVEHVIEHEIDGTWPVGAPGAGCFAEELTGLIARSGSRSRIIGVPRPLFKTIAWLADRAGLIPFTRWHYGTLGHDFAFDPAWAPPGFVYRHRNADVLASVVRAGTGSTATSGTSPHTRNWETGTLDRAVGGLTKLLRGVRITRRTGGFAFRVLGRITRSLLAVLRGTAWAGLRLLRWGTREARKTRPAGKHGLRTRILLGPLVDHENPDVSGRALRSLKRHHLAAGRGAGLGMILTAQLRRLHGRGPLEHALLRTLLAPVLDLGAKLRAAHLSAALAEPAPLTGTPTRTTGHAATGHATTGRATTRTPAQTDLLVIGSGPGAAMLVHAAKEQGERSILVLESGKRSSTPTERHHSLEHVLSEFADGGAELCLSRPLTQIAQGRVLGGGSEVNSGFYHDLPEHHRHRWCRALGIDERTWLATEAEVRSLLELGNANGGGHSVIARGAAALGVDHAVIPRWRKYTDEGFAHHGMTRQIWDRHPELDILTGETATGIEATRTSLHVRLASGALIRARRIAVCAGTTGTARLLHASGLVERSDLRFSLHPMVRIVAECNADDAGRRDVDPYQAFAREGIKYGGAVSTPSLLGAALGRVVGPGESERLRSFYASFEPGGRGGFLPTPAGLLPWYRYSRGDTRRLHQGAENLTSLLLAAGVRPITGTGVAATHPSSVHVFGSLPAGGRGLLPESSLLADDPRIAVYDASLLPTPIGVNPQGAVMTLSLILARRQLHL